MLVHFREPISINESGFLSFEFNVKLVKKFNAILNFFRGRPIIYESGCSVHEVIKLEYILDFTPNPIYPSNYIYLELDNGDSLLIKNPKELYIDRKYKLLLDSTYLNLI